MTLLRSGSLSLFAFGLFIMQNPWVGSKGGGEGDEEERESRTS